MKNSVNFKKNIFMLVVLLSLIVQPTFSQTSTSSTTIDSGGETLPALEDVKGYGKVICELRVPPVLVQQFDKLLSGGKVLSDGTKIFLVKPKGDTITLNDKLDDSGNVISGQKTIAFRTRDFVDTDTTDQTTTPNFYVDSVASYDITTEDLKRAFLGTLASGEANFNFLAWKGTAEAAESYKVTNATDMSFAVARISSFQPLTYINSDGVKVKSVALSGKLKVSTDVNFLARKKENSSLSNQVITTGTIVLVCNLYRCVLDRLKRIELINQALNSCSNILFSGGTVVPTQTDTGIVVPQCVCGTGQSLGYDGTVGGEPICCDSSLIGQDKVCPASTTATNP